MRRLGPKDWDVINAALAMYEADDLETEASAAGVPIEILHVRISTARAKVWERTEANERRRTT